MLVFLDGVSIGTTEANGSISLELSFEKTYAIRVLDPGLSGGTVEITLDSNCNTDVEVVLTGGGVVEDADLSISGVVGGILDVDFTSLTLQFVDNSSGSPAVLTSFMNVILSSTTYPSTWVDVTEYFQLAVDGRSVVLQNAEAFRSELAGLPFGQAALMADGDNDMFTYSDEQFFFVGSSVISGTLLAPPSNVAIELIGLTITAIYLPNPGIKATTTTEEDGTFFLSGLPAGNWELRTSTQEGSIYYNGSAIFNVLSQGFISLGITMLTTEDILNGVPPFQILSQTRALLNAPSREASFTSGDIVGTLKIDRQQEKRRIQGLASVFVTSAAACAAVTDVDKAIIPQGTQFVNLKYRVSSDEYPTFVFLNSEFDDVWSLEVFSSTGQQLYYISRNVNSMVSTFPFFQGDGSTGLIVEDLDVSAFTATSDAEITVLASSTNIADPALPTTVEASLDFLQEVKIKELIADSIPPTIGRDKNGNTKVWKYRGDGKSYSIPRDGHSNVLQRKYTIKYTKPDNADVTKVTVKLKTFGGKELMTIYDDPPNAGAGVKVIDDETIEVKVTPVESTVPSTDPPPTKEIIYEFTIEAALLNGSQLQSDTKSTNKLRALWDLPGSFSKSRYGTRDVGGDGWCQKGTYNWLLTTGKDLIINDISGEHGRNIFHSTHAKGTDIDAYHFTILSTTMIGSTNYEALRNEVINALDGIPVSKDTVREWMLESRKGLDFLSADGAVVRLYYHFGKEFPLLTGTLTPSPKFGLPNGWAQQLLLEGKMKSTSGIELDLNITDWSNQKVKYNNKHNSHLHIKLDEKLL